MTRMGKKKVGMLVLVLLGIITVNSQSLPPLQISQDKTYFVTGEDEKPFFWLGGTAWEMIHRLTREEVDIYLEDRANKGFTIIQTVILAELDGIHTPNAYGDNPLINKDPTLINEAYFEHVDYVLKQAENEGLYVGLLPTWGDKFNLMWGPGPLIFTPENARVYGTLLATRYKNQSNIVWILGGDRGIETVEQEKIIQAMAEGIRSVDTVHLMTYHPAGAKNAIDYVNDNWLDFDMFQSGHSSLAKEYSYVQKSRNISPRMPVVNGEGRYENIGDRFWEKKNYRWLDDADVRVSAYWTMMAGAAGFTYGCNDIWQMYDASRTPVVQARTGWQIALNLPGSAQMGFMRDFFEAIPWYQMIPYQAIITSPNPEDSSYAMATIDQNRKFAVVYIPTGKSIELDLEQLKPKSLKAFWYNPRSGSLQEIGTFSNQSKQSFEPWAQGRGSDFILVVMDENLSFEVNHHER